MLAAAVPGGRALRCGACPLLLLSAVALGAACCGSCVVFRQLWSVRIVVLIMFCLFWLAKLARATGNFGYSFPGRPGSSDGCGGVLPVLELLNHPTCKGTRLYSSAQRQWEPGDRGHRQPYALKHSKAPIPECTRKYQHLLAGRGQLRWLRVACLRPDSPRGQLAS